MKKSSKNQSAHSVTNKQQLDDIMTRGVIDIIPLTLFQKKLKAGERMKIYLGVDPTGPDIHLGHAVILRKLRQLQDLGHEIVLLIGDFTARIGDPTDKEAARVTMTPAQVNANAKGYKEQAAKILDFSTKHENPARLEFNSKWLDKMSFQDVMELAANFTVQQMMERDMFEKRMADGKPIYVHEFFYPMMQGWDSVVMDVDMEVGGNDQLFNMLTGRTLQKVVNGTEKVVMTFEFLAGTDGRKMSKSYGNDVGVADEPFDIYGKLMSLDDSLITQYMLLATDASTEEVDEVEAEMIAGAHPRDVKMQLAHQIVSMYHSEKDADAAQEEFVNVFQKKNTPAEMGVYVVRTSDVSIIDLLVGSGLVKSKSEARRLVEQGGARINDKKVGSIDEELDVSNGDTLQAGKRKFVTLKK